MPYKRFLTQRQLEEELESVVFELENDNNVVLDAVYIPPDTDALTDEEDIDDENILAETAKPNDIVGTFELHIPSSSNSVDVDQNVRKQYDWDSSDEETLETKKRKITASVSRNTVLAPQWLKGEIEYTHSPISTEHQDKENVAVAVGGKTPLEVFFLFFDEEVTDLVLRYSHKYAADNNRHDFIVSKEELLNFIGIMYLSGYHTLPQTSMYWSTEEDKGVGIVKNCMSRNRFYSIKRNLHLSDNEQLDKNDKFSKIRPFVDIINRKNLQWGIFNFHLSIDEQMVPYFGRHSCKMFIKGKPNTFRRRAGPIFIEGIIVVVVLSSSVAISRSNIFDVSSGSDSEGWTSTPTGSSGSGGVSCC
ncbi:piggyBac transposable element-derived protein 3-like [Sitophilus oryzae]|uniref:PiggyBac transposable element-derived protein 3-like n=1 Tax=Sitophilus oryzae TaxID=7048 RepID=A0A6J2XLG9_SITOR|nr:piggyBac transposable element-derived protein 3-like [Sitophilus oryzae]